MSRRLNPVAAARQAMLVGMATVTTTAVERTGPAVRAALAAHSPSDELEFVAELRAALADAGQDLDLAGPQAVLICAPLLSSGQGVAVPGTVDSRGHRLGSGICATGRRACR